MAPKVSVIIPVFNCKPYLADCLRSVTSQSEADLEIIVADDGSTDGSWELLQELASSDKRLSLYRQRNSGCPGAARNLALSHAAGRYIAFLDADDLYHPDKVKKAVEVFEAFGDIDIFFHDVRRFKVDPAEEPDSFLERGKFLARAAGYLEHLGNGTYLGKDNFYVFASVEFCPFHTSSITLRRELFESAGTWFREDMPSGQDTEFWFRLAKNRRVAYLNEVLSYYRKTPRGVSSDPVRYLLGCIQAHGENLRRGMDVFSEREAEVCRARLARYLSDVGYLYFCRFNPSEARRAYRRSLGFQFRSRTLTAYLKTFVPGPVVRAYRKRNEDSWRSR